MGYWAVKPYIKIHSVASINGNTNFSQQSPSKGYNFLNYTDDYYAWDSATHGVHSTHEYKNLATATSTSDGLYDWRLDGTYKATTPAKVAFTVATGTVKIDGEYGHAGVAAGFKVACAVTAQSQLLTCASSALPRVGARVVARGGAHAGALSAAKTYYVRAIVAGNDGTDVTQFHISQDTEAGVAGADCQVQFISDWIQPGMRVEGTGLLDGGSITEYFLGTESANETDKRVFQLQKYNASGVLTNVTGEGSDQTNQVWTCSKPQMKASNSYVTYDSEYYIEDVASVDIKVGDRFKVTTAASGSTTFSSISDATASTPAGPTIYTATGAGVIDSVGKVTLVNPASGTVEAGLTDSLGNAQFSSRSNSGYQNSQASAYGVGNLQSIELGSDSLVNSFYTKDFQINVYNAGEEDVFLARAEWIPSQYIPSKQTSQNFSNTPIVGGTEHAGHNWTVAATSTEIDLAWTGAEFSNEDFNVALLSAGASPSNADAARLTRDTSGFQLYCRFNASETNSNGVFFQTLKLTHYRRQGQTDKALAQGNNFVDKTFAKREKWVSYHQFSISVASSASISVTDTDNFQIVTAATVTFSPTTV